MSQFYVRRMSPDEAAEVTAVCRRLRLDSVPQVEARLAHSLQDDLKFFPDVVIRDCDVSIAEVDGVIVGMRAIRGADQEKHIVEPVRQRRGIGTVPLEKAKFESPSGLTLYTHQVDSKAPEFYENSGLEPIEFRMSPPRENEPDVKYVWSTRRPENAAVRYSQTGDEDRLPGPGR